MCQNTNARPLFGLQIVKVNVEEPNKGDTTMFTSVCEKMYVFILFYQFLCVHFLYKNWDGITSTILFSWIAFPYTLFTESDVFRSAKLVRLLSLEFLDILMLTAHKESLIGIVDH